MKEGFLIYDHRQERFDIRFSLEDYYGGLTFLCSHRR